MLLHANAVAENRSAGIRAGGIDGDDADGVAGSSEMPRHVIDERALSGSGRAGEADDAGLSGVRKQRLQQIGPAGGAILDQGDGAGEGAGIAGTQEIDRWLKVTTQAASVKEANGN